MIRKAAASGASAVCVNRSPIWPPPVDLGDGDIIAQICRVAASVNSLIADRVD
ncbi:hypothetical protein [Rhizobium sp. RU33A]|uniref:hypothetical protein n=1 Tax=Rhizobium sp. RU33A TaxID=1907413 RepID=UPI00158B387E|nr:hypothetical protein [Rhizobium sp. RU33A]